MDGEGNPGSGENIRMIDQQQEDGMQQEMGQDQQQFDDQQEMVAAADEQPNPIDQPAAAEED